MRIVRAWLARQEVCIYLAKDILPPREVLIRILGQGEAGKVGPFVLQEMVLARVWRKLQTYRKGVRRLALYLPILAHLLLSSKGRRLVGRERLDGSKIQGI